MTWIDTEKCISQKYIVEYFQAPLLFFSLSFFFIFPSPIEKATFIYFFSIIFDVFAKFRYF